MGVSIFSAFGKGKLSKNSTEGGKSLSRAWQCPPDFPAPEFFHSFREIKGDFKGFQKTDLLGIL
jgi:hypothetical protein